MTSPRDIALSHEILRGVVGSTAWGTALGGEGPPGQGQGQGGQGADRDEMGVFVEPPAAVCGLTPCDHYVHRDQPDGVRSGPGDLDLTMYSLRRFCALAAHGNPTVLSLLYLPAYITLTPPGAALVGLREAFLSRDAGRRFLGYLRAQKARLRGERDTTVNRPELVEKYGYDTKFAMHALRLGLQGIELMTERRLTLPVPEPDRATLRAVRGGSVGFGEALALIDDAETRLVELVDACTWQADRAAIDAFLVAAHLNWWRSRGLVPDAGPLSTAGSAARGGATAGVSSAALAGTPHRN